MMLLQPFVCHSLDDMVGHLYRIASVSDHGMEDHAMKRQYLEYHPMKAALYQVLVERKADIALSMPLRPAPKSQDEEQHVRMDNMLKAKGVIPSDVPMTLDEVGDCPEYKENLDRLRTRFAEAKLEIENMRERMADNVGEVLEIQRRIRPIAENEKQQLLTVVRKKLGNLLYELKQRACENVMIMRSKFTDARRKRRNFTKSQTEALNEYFFAHLQNPYPSEEAKEELARRCKLTVSQVSNWFGNKRIRLKKNIHRAQQEANAYAARKAMQQYPYGYWQ